MASTDLLHIERGDHDGTAILQLEGELDLATAGLVPEAVSRLLLHIRRRMWRSDGTVAFVCAQEPTGRVLRVMGLYDPLECTDDFETALARARA
jgi:anti-anti-sigma regulatory factor